MGKALKGSEYTEIKKGEVSIGQKLNFFVKTIRCQNLNQLLAVERRMQEFVKEASQC